MFQMLGSGNGQNLRDLVDASFPGMGSSQDKVSRFPHPGFRILSSPFPALAFCLLPRDVQIRRTGLQLTSRTERCPTRRVTGLPVCWACAWAPHVLAYLGLSILWERTPGAFMLLPVSRARN